MHLYADLMGKCFNSQFDLVLVNDPADLATQDHLHDMMMDHVFSKCTHQHSKSVLPLEELQHFINFALEVEVELTEEAAELLKAFYVASRKVRVSMSRGADVPLKALNSLYVRSSIFASAISLFVCTSRNTIACAHAKINLRKQVRTASIALKGSFIFISLWP